MKERKKRSQIWLMPKDDFEKLVAKSKTYTQILAYFGMANKGGNFRTLKRRIAQEAVDDSHVKKGRVVCYANLFNLIPLERVLVAGSTYNRKLLKRRILEAGLVENRCQECGLGENWNGKPLVLQLDHINGDPVDNRIDNLRMVCPNCHSQQPTFAGRNSWRQKTTRLCSECNTSITKASKTGKCSICVSRLARKVLDRPSIGELKNDVKQCGYEAVGRKHGVTGNAIRKWMK